MSERLKQIEIPLHERKPVGERVLGDADPRGLSREEFDRAPGLLFHGSAKPIDFHQVFDYRAEAYIRENDGSATLGLGFYSSDKRSEAEHYSRVRKGDRSEERHVTAVLPFQAKILDLRWEANLDSNAPFPQELVKAWIAHYLEYFKAKSPREGFLGEIFDSLEAEYIGHLLKDCQQRKAIDLRVLLWTNPYPSPPWVGRFSDFMMSQGYDGLIYNEGGEGWDVNSPSFVFYNLKKIGTYESWNRKE